MGDYVILKLLKILKRIVISMLLIYSFDVLAVSLNITIPINIITIALVFLFDIPAIGCLVFFSLII